METKGGGGEIRRVHVVYFLSRMGRIEHPHLIRVHHQNRNGVHLRDVKRWLSDLRGKDMPDSFSWSYKRRYKSGYVWQDLMDDDLITPISDNEYVLKGTDFSLIRFDLCSCGEKKASILDEKLKQSSTKTTPEKPERKIDVCTKSSQTDEEDSGPLDSETTTTTDESIKMNPMFSFTTSEIEELSEEIEDSSIEIKNDVEKPKLKKTKGSSKVFRNLLNCGAVETKDSTMMIINKSYRSESSSNKDGICKEGTFDGPERIFGGARNQQQRQPQKQNSRKSYSDEGKSWKKSSEFPNQKKKVSAAYMRVPEPICSQCKKSFKPEKLYTHMKSCKGLKSLSKSPCFSAGVSVAAEMSLSKESTHASSKETHSAYLLTH